MSSGTPNAIRLAFFGSPEFAVPTLRALIGSPWRPVVVVTQPDRPAGRSRKLTAPPAKIAAEEAGVPVIQPERLREPESVAALAAYKPNLQVIAAYGQIIRRAVLDLPAHGTLNVHASLLPRWRGAAPVAAAIRAGDSETGVTIMLVDEGVDTGAMLSKHVVPIRGTDTTASLSERLAQIGADLLLETIPRWIAGEIVAEPQDESRATKAPRLKKEEGRIDWSESADQIARTVRAFTPWPGATTTLGDTLLRVRQAEAGPAVPGGKPGTVLQAEGWIGVQTGAGILILHELQREGKRPMTAKAFARGERRFLGGRLG
ncbi:MAG: methionyl-tRNA formyltransferase [Chloroflexi bacterium]|nr:methionyl-tRNA formyltransferase [Chloroflexota bacterium]